VGLFLRKGRPRERRGEGSRRERRVGRKGVKRKGRWKGCVMAVRGDGRPCLYVSFVTASWFFLHFYFVML